MNTRALCWNVVWGTSLLLTFGGLVMVYSSSAFYADANGRSPFHFFSSQVAAAAVGLILMHAMLLARPDWMQRASLWLMLLSLVLLTAALTPGLGVNLNNANRWIEFGGMRVQPSEGAKFALVLYLAAALDKAVKTDQSRLKHLFKGFVYYMTFPGVFIFLLIIEPDVGTAALIGATAFLLLWIAGTRLFFLGALAAGGIGLLVVVAKWFPHILQRFADYFILLKYWFGLVSDMTGVNEQMRNSIQSIGSGGVTGLGIGAGIIKINYLPQMHSDFIFSTFASELGYIGAIALLVTYVAFLAGAWGLAVQAHEPFRFYTIAGIATLIGLQVLLNIFVVTGIVPQKGLVLPFLSHGGSSLVATLCAVGVVLSLGRERPLPAVNETGGRP